MMWLILLFVIVLSAGGAFVIGQLAASVNKIDSAPKQIAGFLALFFLAPVVSIGPIVAGAAVGIRLSDSFAGISGFEISLIVVALLTSYVVQYWAFRAGTGQVTDRTRSTWRVHP